LSTETLAGKQLKTANFIEKEYSPMNPLIEKINNATLNSRKDAFELLGITNESPSVFEVNKAFRTLVLKIHPDKNPE
jgi:preprotein translocase subunit Sec63